MTDYLKCLTELNGYKQISRSISEKQTCAVFGIDRQKVYFIAELINQIHEKFFIITPDENTAKNTYDILNEICGNCYLFPAKEYYFRNIESSSRFDENIRIDTLSHIRKDDYNAVILPAEALCSLTISPDDFIETTLYSNDTINFEELKKVIVNYGYEFFSTVEGPGQYSVRGGIIDIYPPSEESPYRIEFFGDEIDSISLFEIETQRRTEPVDFIRITPAKEYNIQVLDRLKTTLSALPKNIHIIEDLDLIDNGIYPKHDRYIPLYYNKSASILDYIPDHVTVTFFDFHACEETIAGYNARIAQDIESILEDGYPFLDSKYYFHLNDILSKIKKPLIFETFPRTINEFKIDNTVEIHIFPTSVTTLPVLKEDIHEQLQAGYTVYLLTTNTEHKDILTKEFDNRKNLIIESGFLPYGFSLPEIKKSLFTYNKSIQKKKKYKTKYERGERIKNFSDINKGDYVVHQNYGIAIYDGIHKVESQGIVNDYIKLKFAGTDVLYVPCSQLDQISKYISGSSNDIKVKLNKLGSTDWYKTKQKVKKSVQNLAKKLIELYGQRLKAKGHTFSPDNEWQQDFEAHFEFEETEDQLRCIREIKQDMESPTPMDRLLCGDVGFGKTEVAIRAIFKCVTDSMQAAVLAPTTILAFQHYQTMINRFGEYPVKVELLSRFRNAKQQQSILGKLKKGEIDVIVGTHRLLQKDVAFKNLGLIVVDEEQRFGVAHKEHLKEMAQNADVLTLSATPIPRTLNMSLSGIRDISMLSEAPNNRHPVTTYVAEYDLGLIVDAIRREINRGGQCFYLHNRIDSIYKTADVLRNKTGYKIQVAHGKMSQEEISDIWEKLVKGEIDVLVCTTIIETGVDVPNCNTLIIEDADRLGLAQLHQIRGRVGRSNKRAYAYFTFRKGKTLSPEAYKRLMTIKEFTEFGSGLKIAMRDMEIRGAGDILGAEQSGHLLTVGFDLYMKLLEEAVQEQRGEDKKTTECIADLRINAYIPDSYIKDTQIRIEAYRMIASISTDEEYSDVLDELIDRFGAPTKEVLALLDISSIRMLGSACRVCKIEQKGTQALIFFDQQPDFEVIAEMSTLFGRKLLFSPEIKPYFTLKTENIVLDLKQFLNKLKEIMDMKNK